MKLGAVLFLCAALAGCASAPPSPRTENLFNDLLFAAPSQRVNADEVFALSDDMRKYLRTEMADQTLVKGSQLALFDALFNKSQLKLEYDSVMTRNAAQAFAARSGNCLSLVIMTAAFAKEMGLPVRYQSAVAEETWDRSGDIQFFVGHVNITLGRTQTRLASRRDDTDRTIDFLPPFEIRGLRTRAIGEETIIAMYMNNRAAETFTDGKLDDAYWWARAAIGHDPLFVSSYVTLGAIYRRHGDPAEAEKVLAFVLERNPGNTHAMSNLIPVLNQLGRTAESSILARKLQQIEPDPPFSFFSQGVAALRKGNFQAARDLFAREVERAPYYHEFHYWLAAAYAGLGDTAKVKEQLAIAMEYSTTRTGRDLYAAKLDRIRSTHLQ